MNDHDAMTAINTTLDRWFRGEVTEFAVLAGIAHIAGQNAIEHNEAGKS